MRVSAYLELNKPRKNKCSTNFSRTLHNTYYHFRHTGLKDYVPLLATLSKVIVPASCDPVTQLSLDIPWQIQSAWPLFNVNVQFL